MKKEPFLEDYTELVSVGEGAFTKVYKVRHNKLEYIRALRILSADVKSTNDKVYQDFIKECKLLLRLGNGCHPNIVHIYHPSLCESQHKAFVEMDFVNGEDIQHYIERVKVVPIDEIVRFVEEISSALAYCHVDIYKYCYDREHDNLKDDPNDGSKPLIDEETRLNLIQAYRVIHNDIHSGNIMRRIDGHYILLDFGLAIENNEVVRKSKRSNGVPEYKAPERLENDDVTTQTDIYSFGVLLYELLTGHVPFELNKDLSDYKATAQLIEDLKNKDLPNVQQQRNLITNDAAHKDIQIPKWLIEVVNKCLARHPKDRFVDGKDLHDFVIKNHVYRIKELEDKVIELERENALLKQQIKVNLQGERHTPKATKTTAASFPKIGKQAQVELDSNQTNSKSCKTSKTKSSSFPKVGRKS